MRRLLILIAVLSFSIPTPARADVRPYVDAGTLLAGEADLTKVEPAALEQWLRQSMTAAGFTGTGPNALKPEEVNAAMATLKGRLADVLSAGGKQMYFVTNLELLKDGGVAVIVPAAAGGDAKKLASLLYSGKADGPTSGPASDRRPGGPRFSFAAEVVNGNVAVYGTANAIAYVKNLTPVDRPDIAAGMAALGDSPARLVFGATAPIRMILAKNLPEKIFDQPMTVVTNDLQWLAIGATLPPTPGIRAIAQSTDAGSAQALHHIVTYGLAAMSGVPPTISPDLAKLLTPELKSDQVVLTLDNDKLMTIAKELAIPLAESRRNAIRMATMNNMRQILMCCLMYANDNKGKYPDDLKAIDRYLGGNAKQVMINPLQPQLQPGFVYIKPATPRAGGTFEKMILYAAHKDFGSGVCVGFLDGHVEFVKDKKRFDDLVAKTALDEAPQ